MKIIWWTWWLIVEATQTYFMISWLGWAKYGLCFLGALACSTLRHLAQNAND